MPLIDTAAAAATIHLRRCRLSPCLSLLTLFRHYYFAAMPPPPIAAAIDSCRPLMLIYAAIQRFSFFTDYFAAAIKNGLPCRFRDSHRYFSCCFTRRYTMLFFHFRYFFASSLRFSIIASSFAATHMPL